MDNSSLNDVEAAKFIVSLLEKYDSVNLILPNGWFGRPFDNAYMLVDAKIEGPELQLNFWGRNEMAIVGDVQTNVIISDQPDGTPNGLYLSEFEKLTWRWNYDDDGTLMEMQFTAGTVVFVVP